MFIPIPLPRGGAIVLLLALLLMACEAGDNSDADMQAINNANQAPPSTPGALETTPGRLLFVRGDDLYHLPLAEDIGEPVLLAAGIEADTISLSPDRRHLLLSQRAGERTVLNLLSADRLRGQQLLDLSRQTDWRVSTWSPDSAWAVVSIEGRPDQLVETATGYLHPVEAAFPYVEPVWFRDGRILFADLRFSVDDNSETLHAVQIYHPSSSLWEHVGGQLPQTVNFDELPPLGALEWFLRDMNVNIIARRPSVYRIQSPADSAGASCGQWHITNERAAGRPTIYSAENVLRLSDLVPLPDDGSRLHLTGLHNGQTTVAPTATAGQAEMLRAVYWLVP